MVRHVPVTQSVHNCMNPCVAPSMRKVDLALLGSIVCRKSALTTHLVARASGANFAMFLAELKAGGEAGNPSPGAER